MARQYSNTSKSMRLLAAVTAVGTTLTVDDATGLPVTFPYNVVIDPDTSVVEVVSVTSSSGNTLTVSRGQQDTPASAHAVSAVVYHAWTALDGQEAQSHYEATGDVHGIGSTADVVGTDTTQALTNKTISGSSNTLTNLPADQVSGTLKNAVVEGSTAANVALIAQAITGQTADVQQWKDEGGGLITRVNSDGELVLGSNVRTAGATNIHGDTTITGTATVTGTSTVGNVDSSGTVTATTVTAGTLNSTGNTTVGSDGSGNLTVNGSSDINGNEDVSGTLTVGGATTLNGAAQINSTVTATGTITGNNLTTTGTTTTGVLNTTGDATVGSDGSGNLTVNGTADINGAADISGALNVGGALTAGNMVCGTVVMTPVANTPTQKRVNFGVTLSGTVRIWLTAESAFIGSSLQGVSVADIDSTGFDCVIYRNNTTNTNVFWLAIGGSI